MPVAVAVAVPLAVAVPFSLSVAVPVAGLLAAAGTVALCIAHPGALGVVITIGGAVFIVARAVAIFRAVTIGDRRARTAGPRGHDRARADRVRSGIRDGDVHPARPVVRAVR